MKHWRRFLWAFRLASWFARVSDDWSRTDMSDFRQDFRKTAHIRYGKKGSELVKALTYPRPRR